MALGGVNVSHIYMEKGNIELLIKWNALELEVPRPQTHSIMGCELQGVHWDLLLKMWKARRCRDHFVGLCYKSVILHLNVRSSEAPMPGKYLFQRPVVLV